MNRLILFLLIFPLQVFAQNTITGRVMGQKDHAGLDNVNVFLHSTQTGAKTNRDGTFTLKGVKNGQYDLVVSSVGFKTVHQTIFVNGDVALPVILLEPANKELNEVSIQSGKPKRDPNRDWYMRISIREFFGETKNAAQCKIINPDVLQFKYDGIIDKLTATATGDLIIENKALGYRIKYLLVSFAANQTTKTTGYTGWFVFSDIDSTAVQKNSWQQKRVEAYLGSQMHFLRSCIQNKLDSNRFTVFKLFRTPTMGREADSLINFKLKHFKALSGFQSDVHDSLIYWTKQARMPRFYQTLGTKPLMVSEFVTQTPKQGVYQLFGNYLMVNYRNPDASIDSKSTFITFLNAEPYFDSNGVILTPLYCSIEGFWGSLRMADLLPVDYELPQGTKIK